MSTKFKIIGLFILFIVVAISMMASGASAGAAAAASTAFSTFTIVLGTALAAIGASLIGYFKSKS